MPERVHRVGNAQPLELVSENLLGPFHLGERKLVVAIGVDHAEQRMRRLGQRFVKFVHAQRVISVNISSLKDGLDG